MFVVNALIIQKFLNEGKSHKFVLFKKRHLLKMPITKQSETISRNKYLPTIIQDDTIFDRGSHIILKWQEKCPIQNEPCHVRPTTCFPKCSGTFCFSSPKTIGERVMEVISLWMV